MTRALAILTGGALLGLALTATLGAAFLYGIGPVEHLIDRDVTFGF